MHTYDPNEVVVNFANQELGGYADGTFVEVSRDSDTFSDVAGADGEVCRVRSRDQRGTIKVTIKADSATNDFLTALHRSDELAGRSVYSTEVAELNGSTICGGPEAWLIKYPDVGYGKDLGTREWGIRVAQLGMGVGGLDD